MLCRHLTHRFVDFAITIIIFIGLMVMPTDLTTSVACRTAGGAVAEPTSRHRYPSLVPSRVARCVMLLSQARKPAKFPARLPWEVIDYFPAAGRPHSVVEQVACRACQAIQARDDQQIARLDT